MDAEKKLTVQEAADRGLLSQDVAEGKREQLKLLFPEVFTDGQIDFEQLHRVMGDWVEPSKERYGLNWPGKADCMKVIQAPSIATLKPDREESVDFDKTKNLFIEGDNLEVLKLLQKSYFGKVKLIYIDPPYNTGNEFIYPDRYQETLDTYLTYTGQVDEEGKKFATNTEAGGRFHTNWLNMMYPRLYLARNLLREDGAIFISIDDHELDNLKLLCDQVFGEKSHVATISVINNLKGRNDKKNVATCHEYLLVYAKSEFTSYGLPLTEEQLSNYKYSDQEGNKYALRDLRKRGSQDRREDRPNMFYPIYFSKEKNECHLERKHEDDIEITPKLSDGSDGRWRWGKDRVAANLDILEPKHMASKDKWGVEYRIYLDPSIRSEEGDEEVDDDDHVFDRTSKSKSFWWGGAISSDVATREFKKLFSGKKVDYPKSPFFLEKVLQMSTKSDDLILDFFAGFSTTAHAVFEANKTSGNRRKFIMVQLPETIDETSQWHKDGYKTIAEIGKERIRRVAKQISDEQEGQLELHGANDLDLGFRVFKLGRSNFDIWDGVVDNIENLTEQLEMHVDHIDQASSPEDILYELLLKAGFELTTKVEKQTMAGKDVYAIAEGALLICLDKEITPELIDAIADADPLQVICLDEGFKGNDQLKTNAVQTFKSRAKEDEEAIVFRTV